MKHPQFQFKRANPLILATFTLRHHPAIHRDVFNIKGQQFWKTHFRAAFAQQSVVVHSLVEVASVVLLGSGQVGMQVTVLAESIIGPQGQYQALRVTNEIYILSQSLPWDLPPPVQALLRVANCQKRVLSSVRGKMDSSMLLAAWLLIVMVQAVVAGVW